MRRLLPFILLCAVGCTLYVENGTLYFHRRIVPTPDPEVVVPHKVDVLPQGQMRCLIIEDVSTRQNITKTQSAMLFGKDTRDFLKANCVENGFRIVDNDEELTGVWADMKSKFPPQSYPWWILVNGNAGEGFCPKEWTDLTPRLNKYAGVKP